VQIDRFTGIATEILNMSESMSDDLERLE